MADRKTASLIYDPARQALSVHEGDASTGCNGDVFVSVQRPEPQFVISGRGLEGTTLAAMTTAVGFRVLRAESCTIDASTDRETAIVLLHHDIDIELPMLKAALETDAFYIGCLGSRRTHAQRMELLESEGISPGQIARIHGPIGMFGPARDARSITVSVLAEVMPKFNLWKRNAACTGSVSTARPLNSTGLIEI